MGLQETLATGREFLCLNATVAHKEISQENKQHSQWEQTVYQTIAIMPHKMHQLALILQKMHTFLEVCLTFQLNLWMVSVVV